ncbi:hypothetical protein ZIOFF_006978 [Zingiber officinale]|uniref:UBC core domain-containing protein n=1 Tax=Zingiber officinale TaxID=94328 RepID=A0A8J5M5G6_ZINOF|nr:hypothetical protein ZIOFF_006978 [Zingiber officinale]
MASSSSSSAQLRLMSDLKAIRNEPPEGCSASPSSDENLFVWSATILGPDETPWEGGVFGLRLTFGDSYPAKPPRVRFTSEVFHPNVETGRMCICTLLQLGHFVASLGSTLSLHTTYFTGFLNFSLVSPASLSSVFVRQLMLGHLATMFSLLTDPNPASPANPEAAQLFQHDNQAYNKRVRRCARVSIEP